MLEQDSLWNESELRKLKNDQNTIIYSLSIKRIQQHAAALKDPHTSPQMPQQNHEASQNYCCVCGLPLWLSRSVDILTSVFSGRRNK